MKKILISSLSFLCVVSICVISSTLTSCNFVRPVDENDLNVTLGVKSKTINSNPTKKGEVFKKTYEVKIGDEFKKQYGLDLKDIRTFFVSGIEVKWANGSICPKIKSYKVKIINPSQPNTPVEVQKTAALCNDTIMSFSRTVFFDKDEKIIAPFKGTTKDAERQLALDNAYTPLEKAQRQFVFTNLVDAIRENKSITVEFEMEAAEDIPAGAGVEITFNSAITYNPNVAEINAPVKVTFTIGGFNPSYPDGSRSFNVRFDSKPLLDALRENNAKISDIKISEFTNATITMDKDFNSQISIFIPLASSLFNRSNETVLNQNNELVNTAKNQFYKTGDITNALFTKEGIEVVVLGKPKKLGDSPLPIGAKGTLEIMVKMSLK